MLKETSAKRVNIRFLKMVNEGRILYGIRKLSSLSEVAGLGRKFLDKLDRDQVIVCCLDNKNFRLFRNIS